VTGVQEEARKWKELYRGENSKLQNVVALHLPQARERAVAAEEALAHCKSQLAAAQQLALQQDKEMREAEARWVLLCYGFLESIPGELSWQTIPC
jgi:hypothetical protein